MSIGRILIPLLIIALVFGVLVSGQGQSGAALLKGIVTDKESGAPIKGVSINLVGTSLLTITLEDGTFSIQNAPAGIYDLVILAPGYYELHVIGFSIIPGDANQIKVQLTRASAGDDGKIQAVLADEVQAQSRVMENVTIDALQNLSSSPAMEFKCAGANVVRLSKCPRDGYSNPGQWLPHGGTTPPNGNPYSGTFFKHYGVNPFIDTEDDHLSTFAIDVDDASYTVTRAYLEKGFLPDPASVRVEEFINFFEYDYPAPESERFRVYFEGAPSKFGTNCNLVRIGIKGQEINPRDRKPAVLTFVIDVSGSMGIDSRLGLVKKALRILVDNLKENDLVGIAVYESRGYKVLDYTSIKEKDKILYAIEQLHTGGSTFAEEGLKIGYQMASENFRSGAINRIVLCSDGVANVGQTGADAILGEIKAYVDKGITLTTVGFGMDNYNDILLEKLGDKGNGHFAYVDNLDQAKRIFLQNLTGTLQVIAKDVKIQVDFDPAKVRSYRLLGYENRDVADDKFRDDKVDGGEIGSGHNVTALYEVKLKENSFGNFAKVYIRYKDPDLEDRVSELVFPISTTDMKSKFGNASSSFKLAACAAQFAEILRESYWAKDEGLDDVLTLAQELSYEMKGNNDVIELTALISKARILWEEKELLSEKK